jgi:cytochrome b subunit of formate dehydrogenase
LFVGSVLALALTGLPQKFGSLAPSRWLVESAGGIETLRLIHHMAAAALIFAGSYHVVLVVVAVLVLGSMTPLRMIPDAKDFRDAIQMAGYFLGLRQERVAFDRPSYFRKIDYWVIVWSLSVMAVSGFLVLFPVRAARLLSGSTVVSAFEVHSDLALLAVAWVVIVHVIYVRLAPTLFPFGVTIASGEADRAGLAVPPAPEPALDMTAPAVAGGDPDPEPTGRGIEISFEVSRRHEEEVPGDSEAAR